MTLNKKDLERMRHKTTKAIRAVDLLIFTPKEEEFEALGQWLGKESDWQDPVSGNAFRFGMANGKSGKVSIGILCSGKGILNTQKSVGEAIDRLQPRIAILFGTAAGLKRTEIGDVLVGNEGRYYEQGKITDEGFQGHPIGQRATHRLVERAKMLGRDKEGWFQYLPVGENPKLYTGPIVCGDKVLMTDNDSLNHILKNQHADAIGKEMESYPFLTAALSRPNVEAIIIRGVSDRMGDKEKQNEQGSKAFALANAKAFLRFFIEEPDLLPTKPEKPKTWLRLLTLTAVLALTLLIYHRTVPAVAPPASSIEEIVNTPEVLADDSSLATDNGQTGIPVAKQRKSSPSTGNKENEVPERVTKTSVAILDEDSLMEGDTQNTGSIVIPNEEADDVTPREETNPPDVDLPKYDFSLAIYDENLIKIPLMGVKVDDKLYPVNSEGVVQLPLGIHTLYITDNEKKHEFIITVSEDISKNGIYRELR